MGEFLKRQMEYERISVPGIQEKKGRKRGNGEDKPDDLGRKGNQSKIGLSSPPIKRDLISGKNII